MQAAPRYYLERTANYDLVRELERKWFPGQYAEGPEAGNAYWLAWDRTTLTPVAFCSVRPALYSPHDTAFLSRSVVAPVARGEGLHRRMIWLRLRWARREGLVWAYTYTAVDNYASANNLLACQFRLWTPTWQANVAEYLHFRRRV